MADLKSLKGVAEQDRKMIADDMRLSRHLHALVQQHPDFEAFTQHLSITTFRYVPARLRGTGTPESEEYLNRLNQDVLTRVERTGEAFLSNAMVAGRFAQIASRSMCIPNPQRPEVAAGRDPGLLLGRIWLTAR